MPALTRPGLQQPPPLVFDPLTASYVPSNQPGPTQYFDSTADAMAAANKALQGAQVAPNIQDTPTTANFTPDPNGGAPQMTTSGGPQLAPPSPVGPMFVKPSFRQASTDQYGNVKPLDSSTTKLGKLFQILLGAGKGAIAGQAENAQTYARTGRNAGFGGGMEGAIEAPAQNAARQQAVERGNLENQEIQANIGILPMLRRTQIAETQARTSAELARAQYWQSAAGQKDQASLAQMHAARVAQVISEGGDPASDQQTQQLASAIQEAYRTPADKTETPFTVWRQQNPKAPVGDYFKLQPEARAQYRAPAKAPTATPAQFAAADARHGKALQQLQGFTPDEDGQAFTNEKTGETISPAQYQARRQGIEDQYQSELSALRGDQQPSGSPSLQRGYVRFRSSDGGIHDLPKQNLGKARQRDPGLTVIAQ